MMYVDLRDVIDGIDRTSPDVRYCYRVTDEKVLPVNEAGDGMTILLPDHRDIDDYGLMADFIEEKTDGEAKEWLSNAIRGKGAFHRFRVTLERFDLLDTWYDYQDAEHRMLAIEWCEDNGIIYEEFAQDPEDEENVVQVSKEPPRVTAITGRNVNNLIFMNQAYRKERKIPDPESDEITAEGSQDILEGYLEDGKVIFAVSLSGFYVGYAVLDTERGYVPFEIFVRPEQRRKGYGGMLLRKCEAYAKEEGDAELTVHLDMPEVKFMRFLKKYGYDALAGIDIRKADKAEELGAEYVFGNQILRGRK